MNRGLNPQLFLEKHNFKFTDYDGCMYGLLSRFTGVSKLPIRHPWRIAYINCSLGRYFNNKCDRSHRHAPCSGRDALFSQGYTHAIRQAIRHCIGALSVRNAVYVNVAYPLVAVESSKRPCKKPRLPSRLQHSLASRWPRQSGPPRVHRRRPREIWVQAGLRSSRSQDRRAGAGPLPVVTPCPRQRVVGLPR